MAPEAALARLLAGTGLTFRLAGGNTVTLQRAQASGATPLGPITVDAPAVAESAYGPVGGYVATRSATGSKTDTPLIETPRSISVIAAEQIEAQGTTGVGGINEVLRYTPGVVAEPRGLTPDRSHVVIRGFNADDAIYRDGMKGHGRDFVSFGVSTIDVYGAERVEVLRGPASVLYGAGRPGGLVNIVTKRPTEHAFGEVEGFGGSFGQHGGKFDLGGPIDAEGKLLFRLTGLAREGETQVDFVDTGRIYFAPALTWRPNADTSLTLLAQYQWDDTFGSNFIPSSGSVLANPNGQIPNTRYLGEPGFDRSKTDYFAAGYLLDHQMREGLKLNHKLRYEHLEFDMKALFASSGLRADNRTANRLSFVERDDTHFLVADTNAELKFALGPTENTAVLGVDHKFAVVRRFFTGGAGPAIDVFNPVYGQPVNDVTSALRGDSNEDLYQTGLYVQNQSKIFDRVVLTLGGRHDWASAELENRVTGATTDTEDTAFTFQGGLAYLFGNGLAPYFSYIESFVQQSGADFTGSAFRPTTGTQYEVGVKYAPPGVNALLTVAGFELTRQNVLTTDPAHVGFSVQTGEVRARGVEVEAKATLFADLNLTLAYTYLDAEVTRSNGADLGKVPFQVPEHTASAWADYTFSDGPLDGFGFGAGVRYVGSSFGNATNTFKVPSFTLLDAAVHYDLRSGPLKGVRLAVNASNLADESYIASCNSANICFFGESRVVTGKIKYRW